MNAVGLLGDEVSALRDIYSALNCAVVGLRQAIVAHGYIGRYGSGEQYGLLRDIAQLAAQCRQLVILYVYAVHQHFAFRSIKEAGDEVDDGAFAAARGADECDGLPFVRGEADVVQHIVFCIGIFEADVFKFHFTLYIASLAFKRAILNFDGRIQYLIDAPGGYGHSGKHDEDHGQQCEGHNHLHGIG